ncbi:PAS domain S-box protein [Bradyrhizobium canariense]|uniref:histidine kinase n=1 Tax=Bradyrhizobium canariense TaxID=255045 RepID=A0A1H1YMY1_9BRAD|nr:PAS domain S-box protein [Bradyrhizobium canariense]SDT22755.1 PAS domain S-box-containing protein [Bradyrhizobium canariense]
MTLTTKLAVAMIALVAIAVSAVGWLNYRSVEQALLPRVVDRIESQSRLAAADLEAYVAGARGDAASFRSGVAVNGLMRAHLAGGIDPVDRVPEKTWRERIAGRLAAELEAKPAYAEIRVIGVDDDRREIVRVDRLGPNGAIRIVADADLKGKGDRTYFKEAIKLRPGEIYVSPLELDRINWVIVTPHQPTLRVATPIFLSDGNLFGIFVINVDMRPALDRIRSSVRQGENVYLVNERGDYLIHPDPAHEFGSELGTHANWQTDFPSLASSLGTTRSVGHIVPDQDGRPGGIALAPAILAGNEWVAVVKTAPNAVIMATAATIESTSTLVGLIAVLCAAASALLVARSLTRPILQLTTAVEAAGRDGSAAIPVDAGGETGVLARAFARVMGEVNAKTVALEREVEEHRRTEAARDRHAARERLFSAAVESSNDAIVTKSLDGQITGWNPAAERLFGFSAAEAVGSNIDLIVPPERLFEVGDILSRIKGGERIQHHETVRMHKNGTPVEVSLGISPIRAPSGTIIGASKTVRDITERKRTEAALNQEMEERRRIFETSQDLILITDPKGTLVQVSPSSEAILGYAPEEMIGRSGTEFVDNDDIENTREEMRVARRGRQTRNFDSRFVHKDGRIVTISWMGTWSEPVRRHFFIGRDMTESRQAQETLLESEQMARTIVETALDAFVQIDESGSIRNWNSQAEAIFGCSRKDALGKNFLELIVSEADRDELKAALARFLRSGQGQVLDHRRELVALRSDGKEFKAELSVTALKTREGFLFNGFLRDLTDKLAAEDRVRQAEKMEAVGQLTGGIAHDFNNILTVITGTIEILADAVQKEPQLAAITRMIDQAASRGAELTQHLLAFARKQPLQPRETDVNALIIDTAKLLRPALGAQIEIESVFGDETCFATVDPNQLATAILNLALNARDAMPDGGKLIIETGSAYLDENYASMHGDVQPGRYALIAVSDTGTGIPPAILDKVFDPFFTSKGPGKGTGLGLSMVYGFVKQSAGHIKIYSEQGHGTTIKIYLPPGTGASIASEAASAPAIQGGHETILVVEDDKLVRGYVLTQLHSLGYATLDAANAEQALALVEAGQAFDLLFTDVIMPGAMNGRQLADALQKSKPGLKVLFTSGYTENAIIHHGRLDSGVLLLAKPYRKSDMAMMIRAALGDQSR